MEILSEFTTGVVGHIAGYIVRKVRGSSSLKSCMACLNHILDEPDNTKHNLINIKNRGGMVIPSEDVVGCCLDIENLIRVGKEKIYTLSFWKDTVRTVLQRNEILKRFSNDEHFTSFPEHRRILSKFVVKMYLAIRIHHAEKRNCKVSKYIRRIHTKLIHFKNQYCRY